jgi:hypothetical protein
MLYRWDTGHYVRPVGDELALTVHHSGVLSVVINYDVEASIS